MLLPSIFLAMKKIALSIALMVGVTPSVILALYANLAIFSLVQQATIEDIQREVDFTSMAMHNYVAERFANSIDWSSSSHVEVGVEFGRPEGISSYFHSLVEKYNSLEWIALVEEGGGVFSSSRKVDSVPESVLDRTSEYDPYSVFVGSSLYIGHRFKLKNKTFNLVTSVKAEIIDSFLDRAKSRLAKYSLHSLNFSVGKKLYSDSTKTRVYCPTFAQNLKNNYVCISVLNSELDSSPSRFNWYVTAFAVVASIVTFMITWHQLGVFVAPITKLFEVLNERAPDDFEPVRIDSKVTELENVESQVNQLLTRLNKYSNEVAKKAQTDTQNQIAKRVAHDVRSPLTALNIILKKKPEDLDQLFQVLESVVSRINDIVDGLHQQFDSSRPNGKKTWVNLALEELVGEKILEFSSSKSLSIRFLNSDSSIFSEISESDLKRALSNIINNSIDSLVDEIGRIEVVLKKIKGKQFEIVILDNGHGIRKDILEKLNSGEAVTLGRENNPRSGSGIGVKSTTKAVENAGGTVVFESIEGLGTKVSIRLPESQI